MERFEHEEICPDRGGELSVGSAPVARVVSVLTEEDGGETAGIEMAPAEARALAALLLKHADRAEGRGA